MTRYQFSVTIGASAVNLATAAFAGTPGFAYPNGWLNTFTDGHYLPAARLEAYVDVGSTGTSYIGPSTVATNGANKAYTLPPPTTTGQYGGQEVVFSYTDSNVVNLHQLWVNGGVPGDVVQVVYWQV